MKISLANNKRVPSEIFKPVRASIASPSPGGEDESTRFHLANLKLKTQNSSLRVAAFTMMEIAISLAIIGIALVAIIGVLPIGMNVQQDNRQQTVVGQDASVFMDAIRNAALGLDDLTNYVYAITNSWVLYNANGTVNTASNNFYTYQNFGIGTGYYPPENGAQITNGANIIGLMSTPEYTDLNGNAIPTLFNTQGYSNHIVVLVHSISGLAVEKPPQDNSLMQQDTFGYRIYCVNAPLATDTNNYSITNFLSPYQKQLFYNLHDLRLTFLWPQLPNGNLGSGRQTFRTLVAGQLTRQPPLNPLNSPMSFWCNSNFYYYQSQWFTNAP